MNKSMTGYGQTRFEDEQHAVQVEVKSLNSKFLDVNIRMPRAFNDKEIQVRNLISERLERGKISLSLDFSHKGEAFTKIRINEQLFREYYRTLKSLSESIGSKSEDLFRLAIQFPEVVETLDDDLNREKEWQMIWPVLEQAIALCDQFRLKEGKVLTDNLSLYLNTIAEQLVQVRELDPLRIERVRSRIAGNLKEFVQKEEIDVNRLEQELIYYIEKLDIKEELVRLESHLDYFREILDSKTSMGKKMNFLAQEIGREINTIGSKSNDAAMQKVVVNMKEELEKIKEQVLNLI
ncbi:MAG: YicC/YloC family endoribonuclease [Cyclobacteriaceae bacterium]|nr:YicC/YloC family endoribonuclease [Cyclobacteriaceae bacterium]